MSPELGKAVYIVEIDERDLERGLRKVRRKIEGDTRANDKQLSEMAKSWNKVTIGVRRTSREIDDNSRSVDRNRASLRRLGSDAVRLNQALGLLGKTLRLAKIPAFTAGIGLAVQAVVALTGAATGLVGALGPLTGALALLPALFSSVAQGAITAALGFKPVIGVLKEMSSAHEQAATSATTNARATTRSAAAVVRAERQLVTAKQAVTKAENELGTARKEAIRQLQELRLSNEGAHLSEKRAIESAQQARKELIKAEASGTASGAELKDLRLSLQEAELGVRESRQSAKRTAEELNEAEKKGVHGSEQMVTARERIASAERQVKSAQESVKSAIESMKTAAEGGSSASNKLAYSMAKLSPEAKKFANFLYSIKGRVQDLQAAAGRKMFPGIESGIKSALKNFPILERVIESTGGALGRIFERVGELIGSKGFGQRFKKIGIDNSKTLERLGTAGLKVFDALTHVMVAARPLVDWFTKLTVKFGTWLDMEAAAGQKSGGLARFFDHTKETMTTLGHTLKYLGEALYNIFSAAKPLGDWILHNFEESSRELKEWTESVSGKHSLKKYFEGLKPGLEAMGRLLHDITIDFFKLGESKRGRGGFADLVEMFRKEALPEIYKFIRTTTNQFAPVLIETLVSLVRLAEIFAGTSGPLTIMVKVIGKMADFMVGIADSSPVVKTTLVTLAATLALMKGLKWGYALSGVKNLVEMFGKLKTAAWGAAAGEEAAAQAGSGGGILGGFRKGKGKLLGKTTSGPTVGKIATASAPVVATMAPEALGVGGFGAGLGGEAAAGGGLAAGVAAAAPIVAMAAAVAALAAGFYLLYKNSAKFREMVAPIGAAAAKAFEEINKQLAPLGEAIDELGEAFQGDDGLVGGIKKAWSKIQGPVGKIVNILKNYLLKQVEIVFGWIADWIEATGKVFSGLVQIVRGTVQIITGLLTGDFGKAWKGVKNIFGGGVKVILGILKGISAPIVAVVKTIGNTMSTAWKLVWEAVKGIFVDGVNAVLGVVNDMIGLLQKLPFIGDNIDKIGLIGGGGGEASTGKPGGKNGGGNLGKHRSGAKPRARGGHINEGAAFGDSVHALLERDEYVLNKKAVRAMGGPRALDAINFGLAPRFQRGGPVRLSFGSFVGDVAEGAANTVTGGAFGAAKSAIGAAKSVTDVVSGFPSISGLKQPWEGMAGWLKDELVDWAKGKEKKFGKFSSKIGLSGLTGPVPAILAKVAKHFRAPYNAALAMFEAGITESSMRNISYGDASSQGVFQLLASTASSLGVNPLDVAATASLFMTRGFWGKGGALSLARKGFAPGDIAQLVEGSNFPDRYATHADEARALMKKYGLRFKGQKMKAAEGGLVRMLAAGGAPHAWRGSYGPEGVQSGARNLVEYVLGTWPGMSVTSTTGGEHAANSLHYSGQAVDIGASSRGYEGKVADWIRKTGLYKALAEGIHNPNLSIADGAGVPSSYWGSSTWADHLTHIHLGVTSPWSAAGLGGADAKGRAGKSSTKKKIEKAAEKVGIKVPTGGIEPGKGGKGIPGYSAVDVPTEPIKLGPLPKTIAGLTKELILRRAQLSEQRQALAKAKGKKTKEAIKENIKLLQMRIKEIIKVRAEMIRKKKIKSAVARISKLADFSAIERGLVSNEKAFNMAEEYASQVTDLEPPEEGSSLKSYLENVESQAFGSVLSAEGVWRNSILGAEGAAATKMASWREKITALTERIRKIKGFRKDSPNAWKKYKGELPQLEKEVATYRSNITTTRGEVIPGWEGQLEGLQGLSTERGFIWPLPTEPVAGKFGNASIWNTQMSIRDLGLRLKETGKGGSEEDPMAAFYKQLAEEAMKRANVTSLLDPIFREFFSHIPRYGGTFHSGGVVPGSLGEERTIIAKAGEIVAQPGSLEPAWASAPHATVIVEDEAVNSDRIRVIFDDALRDDVSTSRRRVAG